MSTTFTAIHVLPNGKELTAEFTISDKDHDSVRAHAEYAMRRLHGEKRVHCWSIIPELKMQRDLISDRKDAA